MEHQQRTTRHRKRKNWANSVGGSCEEHKMAERQKALEEVFKKSRVMTTIGQRNSLSFAGSRLLSRPLVDARCWSCRRATIFRNSRAACCAGHKVRLVLPMETVGCALVAGTGRCSGSGFLHSTGINRLVQKSLYTPRGASCTPPCPHERKRLLIVPTRRAAHAVGQRRHACEDTRCIFPTPPSHPLTDRSHAGRATREPLGCPRHPPPPVPHHHSRCPSPTMVRARHPTRRASWAAGPTGPP